MKKSLLTIVGLLITLMAFAKVGNESDPKYGRGAVPEDENGNVYFTTAVKIPENMRTYAITSCSTGQKAVLHCLTQMPAAF